MLKGHTRKRMQLRVEGPMDVLLRSAWGGNKQGVDLF